MKILHVISYFQPQLGYQEFYLAKEQQKMGHEVTVITSDRYYPLAGRWSKPTERIRSTGIFKEEGLTVYRVPSLEIGTYCISNRIHKLLTTIRPDVVQAHEIWTVMPAIPAYYKRTGRYRYVMDTHAFSPLYVSTKGKFLYLLLKKLILERAVRNADAIVAIEESARRFFSDQFHVPAADITIIPLGTDIEVFRPSPEDRLSARRRLGFEDDDIVITYTGKIYAAKDLHILLKAAAPVMIKEKRVKILIVGTGTASYISTLKETSTKCKIDKQVIFHGFVPRNELRGIYNASDIGAWLAPTVAIVEGMATGLPLILTRKYPSDDYPYAFNMGHYLAYGNGFSFARRDISELTECLGSLVADRGLRKEMGARSRKLAEDRFNWRVIAMKFLETYLRS